MSTLTQIRFKGHSLVTMICRRARRRATRRKSGAKDCAYSMHMALSAADAGLTEAYRSASRLYVRAVNLPAGLPPLGGATGTRVLWGQSGTGRTRAVDGEEEEPVSRFCCMSTAATSHFRQLPTSSAVGVYDVPFPTCKMPSNACGGIERHANLLAALVQSSKQQSMLTSIQVSPLLVTVWLPLLRSDTYPFSGGPVRCTTVPYFAQIRHDREYAQAEDWQRTMEPSLLMEMPMCGPMLL